MKDSDYLAPALKLLKAGKYSSAINELRLVLMDTPAATTEGEEYNAIFSTELRNTRLRVQWLIMIAQRLNGQFAAADETLQSTGHLVDEFPIAILQTDNFGNTLLAQALDGETAGMIERMLRQAP
ncbi:MAG: hypothetical protein JWO55_878 [Candidatus Saccharibacteria bacterium]|nr:hypothetical protein [Candidatus Saccharibacteria bacterium]